MLLLLMIDTFTNVIIHSRVQTLLVCTSILNYYKIFLEHIS